MANDKKQELISRLDSRTLPLEPRHRCTSSVGIAGGGFNPPVNVFNPPHILCLSWGVRNNPHRSQLQTLICHHIPQVIKPCHCCQAYVPYPQSAKDVSCSCSTFSGRINQYKHSTHVRRAPAVKTEPLQ